MFIAEFSVLESTFNDDTCWYLSVVGYGTEELELEVKSSWIFVEQPPQTAGQVLYTDRDIQQSDFRTFMSQLHTLSVLRLAQRFGR